ncbi:hypothetical protein GWK47_044346 [Chionoecetes opilio]|uniref:Uncharacterized protein n=1 Tax=Chionoecetes opilio TaxID=41210 RepID=A0A8J5CY58_CHIOP|nr:hypothetical protein GWK47_044346 [Chionoecetes opilio]
MAACSPKFAPDENQRVNERRQTLMTRYISPCQCATACPCRRCPYQCTTACLCRQKQPGPSNEPQPGPSNESLPSLSEFGGFMMDMAEMQGQHSLATLQALGHTASSSSDKRVTSKMLGKPLTPEILLLCGRLRGPQVALD